MTGHDPFFNDLGGRTSGTKLIDGEVVCFDEITQFVFSDCQYRVKED